MSEEIRKLMEIPASNRVEVCMRLPYEEMRIMISTVSMAKTKLLKPTPRIIPSAPIAIPSIRAMSRIHLLDVGSLTSESYHFVIAQKTIAVKNDENAYTSPSTAENQKVSEKV